MSGFRTVRLGELLTRSVEPVDIKDDVEYRRVTVRNYGRGVVLRDVVEGKRIGTKRQYRIRSGQWLVARYDVRHGGCGLVPPELDGAIVTMHFPTFEIDETRIDPSFLALLTSREAFWEECELISEGSTNRSRIDPEQFLDIEVELPPLDEQRRIVKAVAVAEQAVAAHERYASAAFTALRAAREALLFTEGDWEDLPPGWELRRLDEVADIRAGITKGRKVQRPLTEVPFIRAANVQDGFLDLSEVKTLAVTAAERERFRVQADDILMIEGGNAEHVGRGWLWEGQEEAVCQNHVFRVRVTTGAVIPRFLAYAIGASPARAYCYDAAKKTTNLASISKSQISELAVPVPPVSVQADVVRKLDALRRVGVAELRHARRLTRFRAALIEELVSGARPAPAVGVLR